MKLKLTISKISIGMAVRMGLLNRWHGDANG